MNGNGDAAPGRGPAGAGVGPGAAAEPGAAGEPSAAAPDAGSAPGRVVRVGSTTPDGRRLLLFSRATAAGR